MMKKIILIALLPLFVIACKQKGPQFTIEGQITEAKDTMLYLEHLTLGDGVVQLDSIKLDEMGDFCLHGPRPENPEFYRLRIGGQIINLGTASTETVSVKASLPQMGLGYQVSGSGNCDTIRMLALKLDTLTQRVRKVAEDRDLTLAERDEQIGALIDAYKTDVKLNFIQNRYGEASSYYAMFQEVGGQMVFNPVNDQSDITWFTALANSWEILYPQAPRTLNLQNIALQGHKNTRRRVLEINMDDEKVSETGIIDMGFPDKTGRERRLSELKGNVVLLDFTVYDMKGSQERTLALRELYNKYHAQGFEIYQVSFDKSEHYWKTMSEQLPWVCVWDEEGLAHDIVQLYNLQSVPTWFLINRKPELVGRMELMDDLEKEIQRLL